MNFLGRGGVNKYAMEQETKLSYSGHILEFWFEPDQP